MSHFPSKKLKEHIFRFNIFYLFMEFASTLSVSVKVSVLFLIWSYTENISSLYFRSRFENIRPMDILATLCWSVSISVIHLAHNVWCPTFPVTLLLTAPCPRCGHSSASFLIVYRQWGNNFSSTSQTTMETKQSLLWLRNRSVDVTTRVEFI